ncbi:hypothetical protein HDU98_000180, partial [Podochytrium sp. JEL0797]
VGAPGEVISPTAANPKKDGKEEKEKSKQEAKKDYIAEDLKNLKSLNPKGRLDYVLQEGVLENPYLSSLSSHMTYWPDHDVAVFMLKELHSS